MPRSEKYLPSKRPQCKRTLTNLKKSYSYSQGTCPCCWTVFAADSNWNTKHS